MYHSLFYSFFSKTKYCLFISLSLSHQKGSNFVATAPKIKHPDFLELTVCDNCDLATANESMSLLITSFVSDGMTSSNVSNQTLLTAADKRIITSSLHQYIIITSSLYTSLLHIITSSLDYYFYILWK